MLINEFDIKDTEFLLDKPEIKDFLNCKFHWLQVRDGVNERRATYFVNLMMNRHQKGIYKIMPNFELVIK